MCATLRYARHMEPLLMDPRLSFVLAMWPVWVALVVVWVVANWGDAADTYEEPPPVRPNSDWMTEEERRYHGDDSIGRN